MTEIENTGERTIPGKADQSLWNEHRSRYIVASEFIRGKKVLDVGCGSGNGTFLLTKKGAKYATGIDPDTNTISYARTHFQTDNLEYRIMSATHLDFSDKTFDIITAFEVIEHVSIIEQEKIISEIKRVLKDKGLLIISTPNQKEHPGQLFNKFHIHEMDIDEFSRLLEKHFKNVVILEYSFFIGFAIFPLNELNFQRMKIESTFLRERKKGEPPFFFALCSQSDIKNDINVLMPYTFDRLDYAEYLYNMQRNEQKEIFKKDLRVLVRYFVDKEEFAMILPFLEELSSEQPTNSEYHYMLAFCMHRLKKDANVALDHYNKALENGFDEFWVRYNRGSLHFELNNIDKAIKDLQKALDLVPNHPGVKYILDVIKKHHNDNSI